MRNLILSGVNIAVFLTVLSVASLRHRASATELATVVAGLKSREGKLQSLDIEWDAINYYSPYYGQKLGASPFDDKGSEERATASEFRSTTLKWQGRLVVAGDRLRYEHNMPLWFFPNRQFLQNFNVHAFDGTTETYRSEQLQTEIPQTGYMRDHDKAIRDDRTIAWLIAHVQPTHEKSYLAKFLTSDAEFSEMEVEGRMYVAAVLRETRASGSVNGKTVWFDPSQQWSIRRTFQMRGNSPTRDVHFNYALDEYGVYAPVSWKDEEFDSQGHLLKSISATISKCLVNQTPVASLFTLQFAEKTLVSDQRAKAPVHYSVELKDGDRLALDPTDFEKAQGNIDRIIVAAERRKGWAWSVWIFVGTGFVVVVVGLTICLKVMRRPSA